MERISAYIDAYNLYHSLKENNWKKYYWLDIPKLIQGVLKEGQELKIVYYFTSSALKEKSRVRQTTYIEAMELTSLAKLIKFKVVRGRFKPDCVICNICNKPAYCYDCHESGIVEPLMFNHEKETDVNIAVQMISDAYEGIFDTAILITADSDQVGTIRTIRKLFSKEGKSVGVLIPPGRGSKELEGIANFYLHISPDDLGKNQLPEEVIKPSGYKLTRPQEWREFQEEIS